MHPTDVRMSPWAADSSGFTNYIVGTTPASDWPLAEWHTQAAAAPWADTQNRITFNLSSAQAATPLTLRIGLTRLDSTRPNITVNGSWSSTIQSVVTEPNSRGVTTGNWRGNNATYSFNIPTSGLVSGTNTIDIYSVGGSTGNWFSCYQIYDAIDLVTTSSITNAPVVTTLAIAPVNQTVPVNSQQTYTATAYDQFGNPIAANIGWSTTVGTIDDAGAFIAPATAGSGTITATAGTVTATTNITAVVGTPPTVATAAAASPALVVGTTSSLSVLGADTGGEASLVYTWAATGPASVSFSANGTNAAKNSVATFSQAGTYTIVATITDALNLTTSSTVTVSVNQTFTSIGVASTSMANGTYQQLSRLDQFNQPMPSAIANWQASAGTVSATGGYIAPINGATSALITATIGSVSKSTTITLLSPLAWYQADQTAGPTLTDSSGNSKNGTLSGSYNFTAGVIGNAMQLSGGYASLPAGIVSAVSNFTIAAWINIGTLVNWERVFDFGTGTTNYMFLTPDAGTTNALRFAITTSGGGGEQQLNGPALTKGNWTHVAVTLIGNTGTLYVNGVAVATNSSMTLHPSSLGSTTLNYLGKSQFSADPALQGSIDDFRIYSSGLSAAAISSLYSSTMHTPSVRSISATPTGVTGTTTVLSSLGGEQAGESNLSYTWSATGPVAVTFSQNGSNAAKNATATFTRAGTYNLSVTATDPLGFMATSSVIVTVSQTPTSVTITPTPAILAAGAAQQFAAVVIDQFGNSIGSPLLSWSATGGTVSGTGLFTAGTSGGAYTVTATSGSVSATASATVVPTTYPASAGDVFYLQLAADHLTEQIWVGATGAVGPSFGPATYSIPLSSLPSLTFGPGSSVNGALTIDATNGSPIPTGGISFDGGTGSDALNIVAGSGNDSVNVGSGVVTLGSGSVSYSNLEAIAVTLGAGTNSLTQTSQPGNGASLSFTDPTASDSLTLNGGTFTIPAPAANSGIVPLSLASVSVGAGAKLVVANSLSHADRRVLVLGSLSISASSGTLDLGGNDLDIQNGSAALLATVQSLVQQGYSLGAWTGPGITSSSAAADASHLRALGVVQNNQSGSALFNSTNKFDGLVAGAADILVKYTYYGDLNLDGKVDGSDYSLIDNGYLQQLTGWLNGDLNMDGAINGSDYTLIDNAFNTQGASLAAEIVKDQTNQLPNTEQTKVSESGFGSITTTQNAVPSKKAQRAIVAPITPTFKATVGDSAVLTRFEQNADLVELSKRFRDRPLRHRPANDGGKMEKAFLQDYLDS